MSDITLTFHTDKGDIQLDIFTEHTPLTAANFLNLALRGYFDDLNFHRVISDFMIQGGCPHGTGYGGPGYRFEDECTPHLKHDKPGILSMANAGPNTNGSQFFITHTATPHLDGMHTVFGQVKSSNDQDVVDSIRQGDKISKVTVNGSTEELFNQVAERLNEWNAVLDREFSHLKPATSEA